MLYKKKVVTLKTILIALVVGIIFTGLTLLYSQTFTTAELIDALFISGFLLFALGWLFFITNENLFSLMNYGVQSFWLNIAGKRKNQSYIDYITEKPKISSHVFKSLWIASVPFLLIGLILLFI